MGRYDVRIARPINAKGGDTLRNRINDYVSFAAGDGAALVVFDSDEHCALELVREVCDSFNNANPGIPVAIVCAVREFESWILASFYSVSEGSATFEGDPDAVGGVKEILRELLPGRRYKETSDQARLASRIDLDLAAANSRSFRRLCHAVEELVEAIDLSTTTVTPNLA